jgi:hypothetical protein
MNPPASPFRVRAGVRSVGRSVWRKTKGKAANFSGDTEFELWPALARAIVRGSALDGPNPCADFRPLRPTPPALRLTSLVYLFPNTYSPSQDGRRRRNPTTSEPKCPSSRSDANHQQGECPRRQFAAVARSQGTKHCATCGGGLGATAAEPHLEPCCVQVVVLEDRDSESGAASGEEGGSSIFIDRRIGVVGKGVHVSALLGGRWSGHFVTR